MRLVTTTAAGAHVAAAARTPNSARRSTLDEMYAFGRRYPTQRADLRSLEAIPLTNTAARQRATDRRDARARDSFFGTPGLNY